MYTCFGVKQQTPNAAMFGEQGRYMYLFSVIFKERALFKIQGEIMNNINSQM